VYKTLFLIDGLTVFMPFGGAFYFLLCIKKSAMNQRQCVAFQKKHPYLPLYFVHTLNALHGNVAKHHAIGKVLIPHGSHSAGCCPCCLVSYMADTPGYVLPCSHCFHRSCIDRWIAVCAAKRLRPTCPLCRESVPVEVELNLFRRSWKKKKTTKKHATSEVLRRPPCDHAYHVHGGHISPAQD
jgi:hypothetical protein